MKRPDEKTTIDLIIAIAGLVLLKLCGTIFGTVLIIAAGGILYRRTKQMFTYPIITLIFNFICSIIDVVGVSSSIDSWLEIVPLDALASLAAELGAWVITAALSIEALLYCGIVFLLMVVCNMIIKKKTEP